MENPWQESRVLGGDPLAGVLQPLPMTWKGLRGDPPPPEHGSGGDLWPSSSSLLLCTPPHVQDYSGVKLLPEAMSDVW